MAVRKAVGDNGRDQQIVKTLRWRGYRFVAAVVAEEALTREPEPSPPVATPVGVACPPEHHHSGQGHFCPTCGAPLPVICPQCQQENAPGSNFCNACGMSLAQAAPARLTMHVKAAEPLSYTPRHLAEEILTTRSALEGERKQVTVLFCDLVGSTPLADHLGPEGMHALLNRFFEFALSAVHRYGGTINQFLGDGFMALFGAPLAQEDHTRRAVLAALELHQNVQGRPLELPPELGTASPCLEVRMGLHMGTVVVGSIGDNLRMDYTAVGDTTHLAARLQQMAEPGTILISDGASQLVQHDVLMEPLGPVVVKGKAEAVSVYQVVGRSAGRPAFDRGGRRRLTRFVGRQRELQDLHEQFEAVARGQGRVVAITGEPGMGKSRLIHEFRRRMAATPARFMTAHCVSYGHAMPYLPVLDLLRHLCDLSNTDSLDITEDDVRRPLQALGIDAETWAVYLLHALGLKTATERLASLGSEVVKTRMFETLLSLCLAHSQQQPLILVMEDLHWIDQSSEDFLSLLVERLHNASILLLLTYRPDYRAPWRGDAEIAQID
jgi:class 3 adenylate cyclase